MRIHTVIFSCFMAVMSTAALADNHFSGPYAGVSLGYVSGIDRDKEFNGPPSGYYTKTRPGGALFGAVAGYDIPVGYNIVLGIEADAELRYARANSIYYLKGAPSPTYPVKANIRDSVSLRPVLGYAFSGGTMAFVTGGFASASIRRSYGDTSIPATYSTTTQESGWTAGLGVDHLLTDKLSLRVEGRYADYGEKAIDSTPIYGGAYSEHQTYREMSLRAGVNYHF